MLFDVLFCGTVRKDAPMRRRVSPALPVNTESFWRLLWQRRLDRLEALLERM